jgi:hypothetical protein
MQIAITALTDWSFEMEMACVYCAAGNESLVATGMNLRILKVKMLVTK